MATMIPYKVKNSVGCTSSRNTKLAAGMTKTLALKPEHTPCSDDACSLSVRGTCDRLRGLRLLIEFNVCSCCGQKDPHKRKLNKSGKSKLIRLRNQPKIIPNSFFRV